MAEYKTKEELYAVLDKMVANLQADPNMKARIGQAQESIAFIVKDLGGEYAFKFAQGTIVGSPNGADSCSVGVVVSSAMLDRLFSGREDPESAYSYGTLSLRGSEWVAEGMLRYWSSLIAAYKKATEARASRGPQTNEHGRDQLC
jgi:hypothetical protein